MIIKQFLSNRSGSVLPMFGLACLLLFGAVGAAVDYSRAGAARSELQAVLDAVALMLSKEALNLNKEQLQAKASTYVASMFKRPEAKNLTVTPQFIAEGNTFRVTVSGSLEVDTAFARLFGFETMKVATNAQTAWEMRRLELALALDNTGSMARANKMPELRKAVKSLLKSLKASARSPDHIKVAIVPFDTVVNVGTNNKDASWLSFDYGVSKDAWQGCVMDRDPPYDTLDTAPTSAATFFPAVKCTEGSNLMPILPLTNDWTALDGAADKMMPNGTTNVTIGLEWGWHALTPGAPLTNAAAPKADLDKVIVLLTDGDNTRNREHTSAAQIDPRTRAACENVKAAGIKLYTIRVLEGNAALLKDCASSATMYYDVKDASQLDDVFAAIAKSLANVRLAK